MRAEHPPLASREWLATMRARLTRPSSRRKEAGAAMFIAIRRRLTLWDTATLATDGGNSFGAIRRFATVVRNGDTGKVLGVVEVGISVEGQVQALHTLAVLLLVFGGLTIVGSAIAGRLLAGRALEPANLAFARQQTFVADAAHELRTPLTLLRADAGGALRSRERPAPEGAELLDDIVTETSHMATLASNMLSLARLDARAMPLEREVVDLAHIAQGVVERTRTLAA